MLLNYLKVYYKFYKYENLKNNHGLFVISYFTPLKNVNVDYSLQYIYKS